MIGSAKDLSFLGSQYLKKYQFEPAQLGIVSVSLLALFLHLGHLTFTHSLISASGDSPVLVGNTTFSTMNYGNWFAPIMLTRENPIT